MLRLGRAACLAREDGQGLVEFALILPFVLLLLVGMIEFGSVSSNVISFRQGVRETGRQGSVGKVIDTTSCPAVPATSVTNRDQLICFTKDQAGVQSGLKVWIKFDPTYHSGNALVICAMYDLQSLTGLFQPFLNGRTAKTKAAFRIEKEYPDGLDGGGDGLAADWMWCTP